MGLFGRNRKALQAAEQALAEARAENQALTAKLAAADSSAIAAERDKVAAELDVVSLERDSLSDEVEELRTRVARAEAEAAAAVAPATSTVDVDTGVGGCWALLLGNLERRWVAAVGVQPDERGLKSTGLTDQLVEVLEREIERVREEVGVDVSLTVTNPAEPEQPVVFLLAALDLLGAVVFTCEKVRLELDGDLLVVGETWTELGDEIETARRRAVAAGAAVDEIDVGDEQVRVTLHA